MVGRKSSVTSSVTHTQTHRERERERERESLRVQGVLTCAGGLRFVEEEKIIPKMAELRCYPEKQS
jgi:hypothetical protein